MKIGYVRVSTQEQNTARQEILMRELGVSANQKMSFFGGMKCNFLAVSIRWICSLDYPLLADLEPVKS